MIISIISTRSIIPRCFNQERKSIWSNFSNYILCRPPLLTSSINVTLYLSLYQYLFKIMQRNYTSILWKIFPTTIYGKLLTGKLSELIAIYSFQVLNILKILRKQHTMSLFLIFWLFSSTLLRRDSIRERVFILITWLLLELEKFMNKKLTKNMAIRQYCTT